MCTVEIVRCYHGTTRQILSRDIDLSRQKRRQSNQRLRLQERLPRHSGARQPNSDHVQAPRRQLCAVLTCEAQLPKPLASLRHHHQQQTGRQQQCRPRSVQQKQPQSMQRAKQAMHKRLQPVCP